MSIYREQAEDVRTAWEWASLSLCALAIGLGGLLLPSCKGSDGPADPVLSDDDDFKPPMDLVLSAVVIDKDSGKVYPVYVPHVGGGR